MRVIKALQPPLELSKRGSPMDSLEMTGGTVEEAIDKALQELGVELEDVEVVVVR